jgi:endonuclease G
LLIIGLLRAKRPRNDGFETFETASYNHSKPLSTYAMSVEDILIITDIDFFPALPDSIEKQIESQVDFTQWNINTHK